MRDEEGGGEMDGLRTQGDKFGDEREKKGRGKERKRHRKREKG